MDTKRFDTVTRNLAADRSRRDVVTGAVGAAAALLGGAVLTDRSAQAKRGGNGQDKHKGRGKGKISFCHREGNGSFHFITVSSSARNAHLQHGDVECAPHPCRTYTGSCTTTPTTGVCDFTPAAAGTACGSGQVCDANGNCV